MSNTSLTTVVVAVGQALRIQFEGTDGEFEIHFDSLQYPNSLVVKETAGISGTDIGEADEILYQERFGVPTDDDAEAALDGIVAVEQEFDLTNIDPAFEGPVTTDESALYLMALGRAMVHHGLPMSRAAQEHATIHSYLMQNGMDGERARHILSIGPRVGIKL